jgi:DNA-binding transcriptional MocR family regulator
VDLSLSVPPIPYDDEERRVLEAGFEALARRPDLMRLLRSQPHAGMDRHREAGARWMRRLGLPVQGGQVVVSCGAQQALAAVFMTLCAPGDVVLTEELTYPGIKSLAALLGLRLQGLAMDEEGLRPDAFEAACRKGEARVLYCIPTLQNPTGRVMSEARRRQIAALALRHGITLVEDDVFGFLPLDRPPPISVHAPEQSYFMTSTSKLIAPGLRIGWLAAPEAMVGRLSGAIYTTAWFAPPPMAELVSGWIDDGTIERFVQWKLAGADQCGALVRSLLGRARTGSHPHSFHVWLELPEPWRSEDFVAQARRRGVAVTPAEVFAVGRPRGPAAVRICPSAERDRGRLERALRTLAELLEQCPDPCLGIV